MWLEWIGSGLQPHFNAGSNPVMHSILGRLKMINTFFISDLHFNHNNIIKYCRPEFDNLDDMHECIITRWNETVGPKDKVMYLGDFSMSKKSIAEFAPQLNGIKHIVLGNHDQKDMLLYQPYFKNVFGCSQYKSCILTHIPVHPCQVEFRFTHNIHGHMHEKNLDDPRYINVSCEQLDYYPIEWEELKCKYISQN